MALPTKIFYMGFIQRILDNDNIRLYTDFAVFFCHLIVTAAIFGADPDFAKTKQGTILVVLETITMVFHLGYCITYKVYEGIMAQRQPWKWLEYAAR